MDPDHVERVVVPGVRVNNPVPKGMLGHGGSYMMLDGQLVPGSEVPPNMWTLDEVDDAVEQIQFGVEALEGAIERITPKAMADLRDCHRRIGALLQAGAEPEDETTRVLSEAEPPVTKKNTVKAPAHEQPAPKKLKPGSPKWVEEQVEAIYVASSNLQNVYPKVIGSQQEEIAKAQKALGHVVRIGANFDQVDQVSRELVQLWNQQVGIQLEGDLKYLMRGVKEAVACVPSIGPWKQVIEKVYAAHGSSWFTSEHFEWLTDTLGLDEIEREWATAVPEAAGDPGAVEPAP
jgi:hypothetical protein